MSQKRSAEAEAFMQSQSKRKDLPCPYCEKRVEGGQAKLDLHIREKHTKEKPFSCKICDKSFARPHTRDRHEIEVHEKHTREKAFRCQVCEKSFRRTYQRDRHEAEVHGVERTDGKAVKPRRVLEQRDMRLAQQAEASRAERSKKASKSPTLAQLLAKVDKVDWEAVIRRG